MSLRPLAARIQLIARGHLEIPRLLRHNGGVLAREFKSNIDRRQNAGEHRPGIDTSGTPPSSPMMPLAKYTLMRRNLAGIHHDHQLKATGRTYREIGIRGLTSQSVTCGGTTARSRRLLRFNYGTDVTGMLSTDIGSYVPPRTPIGYTDRTANQILRDFGDTLVPPGQDNVIMNLTVIL